MNLLANETEKKKKPDRRFNSVMNNLNGMIGDLQNAIYGTNDSEEFLRTNQQFHDILNLELKSLRGSGTGDDDITSFISKLYAKGRRENKLSEVFNKEVGSMTLGSDDTTIGSFLTEVYKNKLVHQADLHDISQQLIELREAVNTMRDAIISADIVAGRINREIKFEGLDQDKSESYMSTIESIENKFGLQEKIKSFIVKDTLIYGEYYAYVIPYSEIFSNFMRNKSKYNTSSLYSYESVSTGQKKSIKDIQESMKKSDGLFINLAADESVDTFIESCCKDFAFEESDIKQYKVANDIDSIKEATESINTELKKDMKTLMSRINVINTDIPFPVLEEGIESMGYFDETYVSETGDHFMENKEPKMYSDNSFIKFMKNSHIERKNRTESSEGLTFEDDEKAANEFKDVRDCYFKMIEPTRVIEIKIMDEVIGYFYIKTDDMVPISGVLTSTLYQTKFNQKRNERDIVGDIAGRIIDKFDKKFLKNNPKFKKIIVEALNFYDLNEQSITFQFIPKEYMVAFKIDKDVDNNGTSMLDGSLFYAKLYLMLLLFKIMSIILYSNDTKVNYIRQSGIDKDLINKVQQIAIQKQSRNINIMDLFNYTSLINKIGCGNELFIPTGRSNERPMETDILSGQDVQINNEFMEFLRNCYILGTGVPAAIMNYLNEADFAKSIEVANTKFNGRVVNYQLDLNPSISELYRKILLFSSNIPPEDIDNLTVSLIAPKSAQNNIKQEQIQNVQSIIDFLVTIYFGDTQNEEGEEEVIKKFKLGLVKAYLPMLNFSEIEGILEQSKIKGKEEELRPKEEPSDEEILGPM